MLEEAYRRAGLRNVQTRVVKSPLRLTRPAECVGFERESVRRSTRCWQVFCTGTGAAYQDIGQELLRYEGRDGPPSVHLAPAGSPQFWTSSYWRTPRR